MSSRLHTGKMTATKEYVLLLAEFRDNRAMRGHELLRRKEEIRRRYEDRQLSLLPAVECSTEEIEETREAASTTTR